MGFTYAANGLPAPEQPEEPDDPTTPDEGVGDIGGTPDPEAPPSSGWPPGWPWPDPEEWEIVGPDPTVEGYPWPPGWPYPSNGEDLLLDVLQDEEEIGSDISFEATVVDSMENPTAIYDGWTMWLKAYVDDELVQVRKRSSDEYTDAIGYEIDGSAVVDSFQIDYEEEAQVRVVGQIVGTNPLVDGEDTFYLVEPDPPASLDPPTTDETCGQSVQYPQFLSISFSHVHPYHQIHDDTILSWDPENEWWYGIIFHEGVPFNPNSNSEFWLRIVGPDGCSAGSVEYELTWQFNSDGFFVPLVCSNDDTACADCQSGTFQANFSSSATQAFCLIDTTATVEGTFESEE